jgi:hypothetical protein
MKEVVDTFAQVYKKNVLYRATGITLAQLVPDTLKQTTLFDVENRGVPSNSDSWNAVFKAVDLLDRRYGTHTVVLGSSFEAFKRKNVKPHRRLKIPYMGEVV